MQVNEGSSIIFLTFPQLISPFAIYFLFKTVQSNQTGITCIAYKEQDESVQLWLCNISTIIIISYCSLRRKIKRTAKYCI